MPRRAPATVSDDRIAQRIRAVIEAAEEALAASGPWGVRELERMREAAQQVAEARRRRLREAGRLGWRPDPPEDRPAEAHSEAGGHP